MLNGTAVDQCGSAVQRTVKLTGGKTMGRVLSASALYLLLTIFIFLRCATSSSNSCGDTRWIEVSRLTKAYNPAALWLSQYFVRASCRRQLFVVPSPLEI